MTPLTALDQGVRIATSRKARSRRSARTAIIGQMTATQLISRILQGMGCEVRSESQNASPPATTPREVAVLESAL
jgi:hypothetical protein